MIWKYKNTKNYAIFYRNKIIGPGEEFETLYPVPSYLELTCLQEGSFPDPVLFHDDIEISAGEEKIISLISPVYSQNVALTISCMTQNSGIECRFNSANNKAIPIDIRGFSHVLNWEMCSKIFLFNPTEQQALINVTAIEVIS